MKPFFSKKIRFWIFDIGSHYWSYLCTVSRGVGTFVLRHRDGTRSAHSRRQPPTAGDIGTRQKRIKQPRERASLSSNPLVLADVREFNSSHGAKHSPLFSCPCSCPGRVHYGYLADPSFRMMQPPCKSSPSSFLIEFWEKRSQSW